MVAKRSKRAITLQQDHDSAIGGTLLCGVDFAHAKATGGRHTIRRTSMDLPNGDTLTYDYSTKYYDDELSRVSGLKLDTGSGNITVAAYEYLGQGRVVGLEYPEADILRNFHGTSSGSYPDLDRFGRLVVDSWEKDLASDIAFYRMDIAYDRNSNIGRLEDHVHAGFDALIAVDGRDRVTGFEQGTLLGASITSATRTEAWTLWQTGNWDAYELDSDGDGTLELDESRSHNPANEITSRDTDGDLTSDHAPAYSAAGAMTDDDEDYEYVYDAFGRLVEIRETGTSDLVAAYAYNGLGYRIGWHHDVDVDGDVDGSDPVYRHVYDPQWRIVGTYRASDADPKEQWVHHAAGLGGHGGPGGSSYVDAIVLRDKDANTAWGAASDGVLEERLYYCQNWRHDVVALVASTGELIEQVRYSPYGVPFDLPAADADSDGDVDAADVTLIGGGGPYDVRRDADLDGDVDAADAAIGTALRGTVLGLAAKSRVGQRRGLSGHEGESSARPLSGLLHARHRVLSTGLGRWMTRDPLGYVDGSSMFAAVRGNPKRFVDASGQFASFSQLPYQSADCDVFNARNPVPSWTTPQGSMPEGLPEWYRVLASSMCRDFIYPSGMQPQDCTCWERARAIDESPLVAAAGYECQKYAIQQAKRSGYKDKSCENDFRHCVWSCCLHSKMGNEDAWRIIWAHECCYLHTLKQLPASGQHSPDDFTRDERWNLRGKLCGEKTTITPVPGDPSGQLPSIPYIENYPSECAACCREQLSRIGGCHPSGETGGITSVAGGSGTILVW